ncbi:Metallo-dependent hydrolase [Dichomitus squalens]|uniref:Adenosine deaminase n=1 Tax=Dichomitus squalens TaxID=114155 RepID=A0A4Q9P1A9_9APHY|nr:Metallo-dependent hydrolase [Dichomitus squalens LYAD-421 SS1]EJF66293.1 Metallo-dependent hydrolase [Dichomitus squalens LYAD-421 SS1]TBU35457.1 Metallo-dependent hydrolase [Dichomitus squalens]TBU46442.1 Metallo-dependent hydrolase [Dichomitus squalens]TBU65297.1 Metallo-dependent hydrolase [Dichomitus squalens]
MDAHYLAERDRLIAEDRSLRVDALALDQATDAEKKADAIVRKLRALENETVWGPNAPPPPGSLHVFPGMSFLTARETIVKTRLFNIISKMPKGGLLHAHLDATVNARMLLRLAFKYPAYHVRTNVRLTRETISTTLPEFRPLKESQWTTLTSLTDDAYTPGSWVPLASARETFDPSLGGPDGFDDWVIAALTINPTEAYHTHNTTDKIWQKFQSTFFVTRGFSRYFPLWIEYLREFFLSSVDDGISYVEPRVPFWFKHMIDAGGEENVPHREWLIAYNRVIQDVKDKLAKLGRADEFVGSKIIYSTLRVCTPEELEWYLEDCIALKQEFPHLICGFDLVGHEDPLKPLIYYFAPLREFVRRQKELGLHIPFIFHAGETLGDGTAADMNLYDAILLGTKRIGHGFSLVKHPRILEICRERQIAVEVCPISNEILRYTGSMPMHPLPILMSQGIHIALSSDDPAMFGIMGLSFDFFQVVVASEVTGLITLKEMAQDSIKYSCLQPEQQQRALSLYRQRWLTFVDWVNDTFGEDY